MHDVRCRTSFYDSCRYDFIAFKNANRDIKQSKPYFDWRYLEKPIDLKPVIVWAENEIAEKVGSLSITPHLYVADNQTYLLGILGDISVSKNWRGKGVAVQMFEYLFKIEGAKNFRAFLVMPNEAAARSLEKAGWRTVLKMQRFVKLLTLDEKIGLSGWMSSALNFSLRQASFENILRREDEYRGEGVDGFDERFDRLWENLNLKRTMIGLRNREYLTWRYMKHPTLKYSVFTLVEGARLCGYMIFRVNEGRCHIDDLLFLDEKNIPAYLMRHFLKFIRKDKGISSISLGISPGILSDWFFYKFGFIKRSDYLKFMVRENGSDSSFGRNPGRWFLTVGDKEV